MDIYTNQFIIGAISRITLMGISQLKNVLTSYMGFTALRLVRKYGPRIIFRTRLMSVVILVFVFLITRETGNIMLNKTAKKIYKVLIHTPAKKLFNLLKTIIVTFWRRIKQLIKRRNRTPRKSRKTPSVYSGGNLPPIDLRHTDIFLKPNME